MVMSETEAAKIIRGFVAELRRRVANDERKMVISLIQAEGLAEAIDAVLGAAQGGSDG